MRVVALRALGFGDLLTAVPALRALQEWAAGGRESIRVGGVDARRHSTRVAVAAPLGALSPEAHGADLLVNLHGRVEESGVPADPTALELPDPGVPPPGAETDGATIAAQGIAAALEGGTRAMCGGAPLDGRGSFYPATVLVDVGDDMEVMRRETFGPVAPVRVVGRSTRRSPWPTPRSTAWPPPR